MRIGILTFHNAVNYGAVLQALATQELLKSMGLSAEIIDYHNPRIDASYTKYEFSWRRLMTFNPKLFLKRIIIPILYKRRKARYNEFLKSLNISQRKFEGDSLFEYDGILIGSDQVWSSTHTGGLDPMYWGNFKAPLSTRIIAWSVCMGDLHTKGYDDTIAKYLKNFNAISVRETSLKNYLRKYYDYNVDVTLDPTLVTDISIWDSLIHTVDERNYILVYAVKYLRETIAVANTFGRLINKKVIVVAAYSGQPFQSNVKQSCGPQDFLSYIKYADLVVTSSFHGTAFSLLFEKNFISVIPQGEVNPRIEDLLNNVQLSNRILNQQPEDTVSIPPINYNTVKLLLNKHKKDSLAFLTRSLYVC